MKEVVTTGPCEQQGECLTPVMRSGLDGRSAPVTAPQPGSSGAAVPTASRGTAARLLSTVGWGRTDSRLRPSYSCRETGEGRRPSRDTWKTHPTPHSRSPQRLEGFVGMDVLAFLSGRLRQKLLPLPPRPLFPPARLLSLVQQQMGWGQHPSRRATGIMGRCLPAVSWRPRRFGRSSVHVPVLEEPIRALPTPLPLPSHPSAGAALGG